jgi:acetoacetate decarboxylase
MYTLSNRTYSQSLCRNMAKEFNKVVGAPVKLLHESLVRYRLLQFESMCILDMILLCIVCFI